jgi:plasmid stabilization system protein ParE
MNPRYILSDAAQQDLFNFAEYIVEQYRDVRAARKLDAELHAAFEHIGENVGIGRKRSDWTKKPYRFWVVRKRYIVVYSESSPPEIIRVISTFQDIPVLIND